MANPLRVVYDNAADRSDTLVASTTAGTLAASNLLTASKFEVWRSTATSATLTLTFTDAEFVGCVCLPFCNLTYAATIRVRGYTEVADASPAVDTGVIEASPYAPFDTIGWGYETLGRDEDSEPNSTYAVAWLTRTPVKKIVIDLVDTLNADGYIQACRIVVGNYWSPTRGAEVGASWELLDTSQHFRNDAGDLLTDVGTKHKKISFDLSTLSSTDRARLVRILKASGISSPVFMSLDPESTDTEFEQAHQIYGKLSKVSTITINAHNVYNAPCEIEEI